MKNENKLTPLPLAQRFPEGKTQSLTANAELPLHKGAMSVLNSRFVIMKSVSDVIIS